MDKKNKEMASNRTAEQMEQMERQAAQMEINAAEFGPLPTEKDINPGTFEQRASAIEHIAKATRLACCVHEKEITDIVDGSSAAGGNFRKQVEALKAVAAKGTAKMPGTTTGHFPSSRGGGKNKRKTRKKSKLSKKRRSKKRRSKKRRRTKRR